MWRTEVGAPITTTDWDDRKLGKDDCTADSRCNFLCALDAETDMAVKVPDGNEGLETSALTSASLFLHGHNLHDFILEVGEEEVDNLELLHWEREEIDLFHRFDLAVLYKTTELGNWDPSITVVASKGVRTRRAGNVPILLLVLARAATTTSTTPTTPTTAPSSETPTSASRVSHL